MRKKSKKAMKAVSRYRVIRVAEAMYILKYPDKKYYMVISWSAWKYFMI